MRMRIWVLLTLAIAVAAVDVVAEPSTSLSAAEQRALSERIERFYQSPGDGSVMLQPVPKYDALSGAPVDPNPELKANGQTFANPLQQMAQLKATPEFDKAYCRFLKMHFPGFQCGGNLPATWSSAESNDRVEALAYSWADRVTSNLDEIPVARQSAMPLWSDDYWKTRWGQTSYRYATKQQFGTYQEAIRAYSQPSQFEGLLSAFDIPQIAARILYWSPAEKYDLAVGDDSFGLTNQQKKVGAKSVGSDGNVEAWMGLCHGWAAASVMVPRPSKPATVVGGRGLRVKFYPADVRAMLTLAWGNGTALSNFVGGRCRLTNPATYPNGRIQAQECFDTNPATFHLALGNMIGLQQKSFVMDATYDYQVWNQPLYAYEFTYFNPLTRATSKNWRDVAVDYDATFKSHDRFQNPRTRGIRTSSGTWDDSGVRKIVGVTATVVYLVEQQPPQHGDRAADEQFTRATYTYDLELHQQNGALVARGGEWHQTAHPDFLWIPRRTTSVRTSFDYLNLGYNGDTTPSPEVAETARQASAWGYPLCQVLKQLVKQSSGADAYRCPEPLP